eukprot:gene3348-biopygen4646
MPPAAGIGTDIPTPELVVKRRGQRSAVGAAAVAARLLHTVALVVHAGIRGRLTALRAQVLYLRLWLRLVLRVVVVHVRPELLPLQPLGRGDK